MSHFTKNKVDGLSEDKIDFDILKRALDLMKENGVLDMQFVETIKNYYGDVQKVKGIGVKVAGDKYGVDLYMENGELQMTSDTYQVGSARKAFKQELTKAYTVCAMVDTFAMDGMQTCINANVLGEKRRANYYLEATGW